MRRTNSILQPAPGRPQHPLLAPPVDRGRLLHPEDVRERYFKARRSLLWIRRNVAPAYKIRIGGTVAWFERDIEAWLDSLRPGA